MSGASMLCLSALVALVGIALLVIGLTRRKANKSQSSFAKSFGDIKTEYDGLKVRFDAHLVNEAQFKTQLQGLMVQDQQGRWWMIGYETGQWYMHDGQSWNIGHPDPAWGIKSQDAETSKVAKGKLPAIFWVGIALFVFGFLWTLGLLGTITY